MRKFLSSIKKYYYLWYYYNKNKIFSYRFIRKKRSDYKFVFLWKSARFISELWKVYEKFDKKVIRIKKELKGINEKIDRKTYKRLNKELIEMNTKLSRISKLNNIKLYFLIRKYKSWLPFRFFKSRLRSKVLSLRRIAKTFRFLFKFFDEHFTFEELKEYKDESIEKEDNKKILHYKKNIVLSQITRQGTYLLSQNLWAYKHQFIKNYKNKYDPIFVSFLFNKFLTKSMLFGKKNKIFYLIFSLLLLIKFYTGLRPFFVFFSSIESSRVAMGHLPKNISGKIQIVPTYLYFDKQFKIAISTFLKVLRKKHDFTSPVSIGFTNIKTKRMTRLFSLFIKNQKIYFSRLSKFTQRKNFVYDTLKKNYYLYLTNRSNLQYRWR